MSTPAPVVIRHVLPAPPQQIWQLFTSGEQLARWFCDAADSDVRIGGEVHAAWVDEDGEHWDRVGVWTDLDPPYRATLEWLDDDEVTAPQEALTGDMQVVVGAPEADVPATPKPRDSLRFAIAPHPQGSTVTVLSPLPQTTIAIREDVLREAAQQGWRKAFEELEQLLATPPLP